MKKCRVSASFPAHTAPEPKKNAGKSTQADPVFKQDPFIHCHEFLVKFIKESERPEVQVCINVYSIIKT